MHEQRHEILTPLTDPLTFAGVAYGLNSSYTDRTGSVWRFDDTINASDGTRDMRCPDHCYVESLADVAMHWGPLKLHGAIPAHSLFCRV